MPRWPARTSRSWSTLACSPASHAGATAISRIADADVAHALEVLALVAEHSSHGHAWTAPARWRLREARCCDGHLAGRLGVALFDHMRAHDWLVAAGDGYAPTPAGIAGFDAIGFDATPWRAPAATHAARLAYPCLDWSERRDHLAGRFASALPVHFIARGWLRRVDGELALVLTPPGRQALGGSIQID